MKIPLAPKDGIYQKIGRFRSIRGHGSRYHPPFPPKWLAPAVGAGRARETIESNPNRIPVRIRPHPLHQPGPKRIGQHIPGDPAHILLGAQGMIVKPLLPQWATCAHEAMDLTAAGRFEPVDHPAQVALLAHLHQPVDMIRHQHPSQHAGLTEQGTVLETPAGGAGGPEIEEDRLPLPGGGGHQVDLVRQGHPAPAQGSLPRFVVSMGVVAVGHRVVWWIVGGFAGGGFAGMARSYRSRVLATITPLASA